MKNQGIMKKQLLAMIMATVLVLSAMGGVFSFAQEDQATIITVLHTNDIHGRVEAADADGMGYAKMATLIKEARATNPNTLLLDGGDTLHGLPIATMVEGESIIEIMNRLGFDAMAAGNHDFNYGQERLVELAGMAEFPILAANVYKEDGSRLLQSHIIKEMNGIKVAIFGLATPETLFKSHPKGVVGLSFKDPVESAKEMVALLKEEADVIIAIGHLGIDQESVDTSIKVAENVEGIHLFVDGHSHTVLETGMVVGDTLIVSAGEYSKYLGVVDLKVKDGVVVEKTARLISKEEVAEVEADGETGDLITTIKGAQDAILNQVIGKTEVPLEGERQVVRKGESNLGNLLTDAFLEVTGADIAMTNGGGIRASMAQGDLTRGDIVKAFPFGNIIETVRIKGSAVKAMLELGTDAYPELKGGFPHVAGMTYTIDLNKPVGDRIVDILVGGQPLDMEKEYILATNDFLAAGGDGYTMLAEAPSVRTYMAMDEALLEYIKSRGVISPAVEGRIKVIEVVEAEKPSDEAATDQGKVIIYTVVRGDWLSKIAARYGTTWQILQQVNKIPNADLIFPGQQIIIPVE